MTATAARFPEVTLLVTHYNRSSSLERLLRSFAAIHCSFGDIVVSDDGSSSEHLHRLKELEAELDFRLVTTPVNRGLGNNINKGQDAVTTAYTLYVQEDFEPAQDFAVHFANAMSIMQERPEMDMARFYAYFKYPYLKPLRNGFSEMIFRITLPGYKKFFYYSDHPHLRRSNFLEKFGRYAEGVKGDVTEYRMMLSFLRKKGKAIYYDKYRELFFQKNSAAEPSTMKRNMLRESNNIFIHLAREIYRHLKFNRDYLFRNR
ncbi:glycosyltransferase [Sediminibacterium soli]|uniref:glycosyltransferase n=1 Tax=Sediminibacterium soli TaxID=2698829 RepID=UPI00137AC6FB|nr:glycosyltransferase [Sediminibacterium soli]NCI45555.1 glycosyltransferase [Sediminibacterium soli]